MIQNSNELKKVFLVGAAFKHEDKQQLEDSLKELNKLCETANYKVERIITQFIGKVNSTTYLGKGKIEEIKRKTQKLNIRYLIFNKNLSPSQIFNIEKITEIKAITKTDVILKIFTDHAKTKQAKIQTKLVSMQYNYSRLKNLWNHLSRIKGGIGFKGPGEKQIEIDRRTYQQEINQLTEELKKIKKTAEIKRKQRELKTNISIIGYTNAGKTTLFNKLTNEDQYTADELFATLDPNTKMVFLPQLKDKIFLSDTIGLIEGLPHDLIASFYSTILEYKKSDLLLQVIDISKSNIESTIKIVKQVLIENEIEKTDILLVFNKIDRLDPTKKDLIIKKLQLKYPNSIFISAKIGENIDKVYESINKYLVHNKTITTFKVPDKLDDLIEFIHENSTIIHEKFDNNSNEWIIKSRITKEYTDSITAQIKKYKLLKSLN